MGGAGSSGLAARADRRSVTTQRPFPLREMEEAAQARCRLFHWAGIACPIQRARGYLPPRWVLALPSKAGTIPPPRRYAAARVRCASMVRQEGLAQMCAMLRHQRLSALIDKRIARFESRRKNDGFLHGVTGPVRYRSPFLNRFRKNAPRRRSLDRCAGDGSDRLTVNL